MRKILATVLIASAAVFSFPASAVVIQGDFRSDSDLPDYGDAGPLVYERTASLLGSGYELDGSDFVQNPSGWFGGVVFVDWDAATNVITLSSQDTLDFQTYGLTISNILFDSAQVITGISLLTNDLATPGFEGLPIVPTLGFTDNSVSISYGSVPDVFYFTERTASFQVTLSSATAAVPEPATWAMMILGFGLVGGAMRRRRGAVAVKAAIA